MMEEMERSRSISEEINHQLKEAREKLEEAEETTEIYRQNWELSENKLDKIIKESEYHHIAFKEEHKNETRNKKKYKNLLRLT